MVIPYGYIFRVHVARPRTAPPLCRASSVRGSQAGVHHRFPGEPRGIRATEMPDTSRNSSLNSRGDMPDRHPVPLLLVHVVPGMRIGLGFDWFRCFRHGLWTRLHRGFRRIMRGAGFLRRPYPFGRHRRVGCGFFHNRGGLGDCRGLGGGLALFRCGVALLCRLGAASRESKHQGRGARYGNESRHICLLLSCRQGHARNSEILPSLLNAITSNASALPSGISMPGEPRGMPGTAIPRMSRALSWRSFAT